MHCRTGNGTNVYKKLIKNSRLDKLSMRGVSLGADRWAWQSRVHPSTAASEGIKMSDTGSLPGNRNKGPPHEEIGTGGFPRLRGV
jgi:hypothetical protein